MQCPSKCPWPYEVEGCFGCDYQLSNLPKDILEAIESCKRSCKPVVFGLNVKRWDLAVR